MRKVLMILALTMVSVVVSSSDASAQRFGGGRGGWGGGGGGWGGGRGGWGGNGISLGGSGFRVNIGTGGYYGNGFNNGYYGSGFNNGFYGNNFNRGYYGSSYGYSTPSYYSTPEYYTSPAPYTEVRQSAYVQPVAPQQHATMMVLLPRPDAQVWFDGAATSQQGTQRSFHSPALDPSGTYTYTIRARWMENGQPIERERRVNVQPGQTFTIDFRADSGESLDAPRPK